MRTEFVKYNRERLPAYQTETTIVRDQKGHRFVRKRSLTREGEPHLAKLVSTYELLSTRLRGAKAPVPVRKGVYTVFDFVRGESIEDRLMKAILAGDPSGFRIALHQYVLLLRSYGTIRVQTFEPTGGLEEFFINGTPLREKECLRVANLDLTFDNIIIDHSDDKWITDYEWVYDAPIPLDFVIFRSLYVFYLKHSNYAPKMIPFEEALAVTGVEISLRESYTDICESFIDHVFGKDRGLLVPHSRMQTVTRYLDTVEGKSVDAVVQWQHDKVIELNQVIEQKEQTATRLASEIDQLSSIRTGMAQEISTLRHDLEEIPVLKHRITQSEFDLANRTDELKMERSRTEELSGSLNSLREELTALSNSLDIEKSRTVSLTEKVAKRDSELEHIRSVAEKLGADFAAKQAELMTMSDWAFRMKLRLEFIDSKPMVRYAEKYYRLRADASDKLKNEGVKELTTAVLNRVMPRRVRHWMMNENPVDRAELAKNVEGNGGKVIIVFPIIPWDFRWQRPQHIVSRFAKNGYTVIFVSMNITPVGRAYKNEKEADGEVTLGKLSDNIYQVWLSSERNINIYHDKVAGTDESNMELGLRAILRSAHARKKYFLVQFPGWFGIALSMRKRVGGRIIFDCMDEHSGFSNTTDDALDSESRLIKESDLVITTSDKLHDKAKALSDNVIMVKNGTDFEHFSRLVPNGQLDHVRRPIIGYYGAIADWFDTEMVEYAAAARPDWSFILIGSTAGCDTSRLEKLSNVHLLGEKPYKDLPGFLYYFDVCTIPFKVIPLTLATNPVKFYEYMSSGKPLVTVRLPELEPHADLCYFAGSKEQFVSMIQKALDEKDDEALRQKRIEFARNNSWDRRFKDIQRSLQEL